MNLETLYDLAGKHPFHSFIIELAGEYFTPEEIISWRGSYSLPAILYKKDNGLGSCTGELLQTLISEGTSKCHEGYKGGEYVFNSYDTPYLTGCPSSSECFQIVGYKEDKTFLTITLLTEDVGY